MSLPESFAPFMVDIPATPSRRFSGVSRHAIAYLRFADQAEQEAAFVAAGFPLLRDERRYMAPKRVVVVLYVDEDGLFHETQDDPGWEPRSFKMDDPHGATEEVVVPAITWLDIPKDFHWPGIGDVSVIGVIYNDDAVYGDPNEHGFPTFVSPPTAKEGWHVNILPVAS